MEKTMHPTLEELLDQGPVLLDGGWGTELQHRGLALDGCAEHWNLTRPQSVEQVAWAYMDAGARILLTNTFRGNRLALKSHGLGEQVADINTAGVAIAQRAARHGCRVFGSLGPSGLDVSANRVSWTAIEDCFREQAALLADGGVEGLVIETMVDPTELRCAVLAAQDTGLPVVGCLVIPGLDSDTDQQTWGPAVEMLEAVGVDVIGANCGCDIGESIAVCRMLKSLTDLPLWLKPNAGLPTLVAGRPVYQNPLWQAARYVSGMRDAGAQFFGGCCGTTPEFIRACAVANQ